MEFQIANAYMSLILNHKNMAVMNDFLIYSVDTVSERRFRDPFPAISERNTFALLTMTTLPYITS